MKQPRWLKAVLYLVVIMACLFFILPVVWTVISSLKPEADIPQVVDELVQKMCAKSREDRHASTDDLRQHIDECLGAMDTGATRSEFKRVGIVIGAIVLVVGVVIYLLSR